MKLFLFLFLIPTFSFANSDAIAVIERISSAREALIETIPMTPYKTEEHSTIKKYFETLKEEGRLLSGNSKKLRRFNTYLLGQDLPSLCESLFLSKEKWNTLINNCTKNRFFLCSEEVRSYEKTKEEFKKVLSPEVQTKLQEQESCH